MSNVCDISESSVSNVCDISEYRARQMFVIFQGTERVKCL